jgi:ElaB/YqjD/DUF883 family membrane-anchored ribosome-binding protein
MAEQQHKGPGEQSGFGASRTGTGTAGGTHRQEPGGGVMEKAQEMASTVASKAGDAWESTKQGAQQAASAVADTAQDAWEQVTSFMRRYPAATLCVGLGLGFLLARLFSGSSMGMGGFFQRGRSYYPSRGSSQSQFSPGNPQYGSGSPYPSDLSA